VNGQSEGYNEKTWERIVRFLNYLLPVCSNIGVSPEGRRKRLSLFVQDSTLSLSGEEFRNWTREGEKK